MLKMVVLDLDGTLLNSKTIIPDREHSLLKALHKNKVKIILATGRGTDAFDIVKKIPYHGIILNNGMCSYHGGTSIAKNYLLKDDLFPLFEKLDMFGYLIGCVSGDFHLANFNIERKWSYLKKWHLVDIRDFPRRFEKAYIILDNECDICFVKKHLHLDYHLCISKDNIAFILPRGISKLSALHEFLRIYNVGLDEVVAFGDDQNDFELLNACGVSVAMENATEQIKKIATCITNCNERGGVSKMLSQLFELNLEFNYETDQAKDLE